MSGSDRDRNGLVMSRRGLLKCAAWSGAGVMWVMQGGVLKGVDLLGAAQAATPAGGLSFVQISDSHIGFNKEPNPSPHATLQSAIDQIKALPARPAFVVHTGDVTHLSKPQEFDDAARIIEGVGRQVHYVPGEHDVIGDDGATFFAKFNGGADRRWHSFDYEGTHFVALVNVLNLQAGGLGRLGPEQLEWLEQDLKSRTASTPVVVLAHMPLWSVYPEWGWGTDDAAQALGYLKRFGSVTVLNGHIHQVMQKVEGHVQFHTARSTAFPQAAPGAPGASPGPLKVPAEQLRAMLGLSSVVYRPHMRDLAISESVLNEGAAVATAAAVAPAAPAANGAGTITISNFTFAPTAITVKAGQEVTWMNEDDAPHTVVGTDPGSPLRSPALDTGDKYAVKLTQPGAYKYFCSLHPHMTGTVTVT
ncbi:MAG TPA: metallophosphoesterase [Steroidobacteraceae bacterium]|jgi:plastocyanin/predicted MPP superfamily phosphohydrolase